MCMIRFFLALSLTKTRASMRCKLDASLMPFFLSILVGTWIVQLT